MNDVVIVNAVRTPIGRHAGALSSVRPDDLGALVIRELVTRSGIDPAEIEEVYFGCANQAGEDNRNVARMATLLAGLPNLVAAVTFNPPLCQWAKCGQSGGTSHQMWRRGCFYCGRCGKP